MKTKQGRIGTRALLAAFSLSVAAGLVALVPASASVKGRRNTAIVVTGAAAYELAHGHTKTGLALGAGAAYACKRTRDAKKAKARHHRHTVRRHRSSHRHYVARRHRVSPRPVRTHRRHR
jgi:hypothetical protein